MRKAYPYQAHIRFTDKAEKSKAEAFAKKNGLSLSNASRLVLLRAIREGWQFDFKTKDAK